MLTDKQKEYIQALKSKKYRYLMFGGAVAGGKTIVTLGTLHKLAIDYPKSRGGIIRKNYTTIKRNTIPSLRKVAELDGTSNLMSIKGMSADYTNGSEIIFIDADITKDPDLDKLKGLELSWCVIEEANEVSESVFNLLKTRVGRWNEFNGQEVFGFIMLTCNPANGWVKDTFYEPFTEGTIKEPYYFLQVLPTDNQYNSKAYLDALKDLPAPEYQRYALGNWDFADDPNQLISYDWYKDCINININPEKNDRIILAIDPAREGDDKTVFLFLSGSKLLKIERYSKIDTTEAGNLAVAKVQELNIHPQDVIIDTVGVGGGVYDTMKKRGYKPVAFIGGATAESSPAFFTFANKRAEGYWLLREAIRNGELELTDDPELRKECLAIRYSTNEKTIAIEKKDKLKQRIGKSPDNADALSMAVWLMKTKTRKIRQVYVI